MPLPISKLKTIDFQLQVDEPVPICCQFTDLKRMKMTGQAPVGEHNPRSKMNRVGTLDYIKVGCREWPV